MGKPTDTNNNYIENKQGFTLNEIEERALTYLKDANSKNKCNFHKNL